MRGRRPRRAMAPAGRGAPCGARRRPRGRRRLPLVTRGLAAAAAAAAAAAPVCGSVQWTSVTVPEALPDWDYSSSWRSGSGPHMWPILTVQASKCVMANTSEYTGNSCPPVHPYQECSGQHQSPVDIRSEWASRVGEQRGAVLHLWRPLQIASARAPAASSSGVEDATTATGGQSGTLDVDSERVVNDGHGVRILLDYTVQHLASPLFPHNLVLREIVYRTPAEHLLDGERHSVERQMVYGPADVAGTTGWQRRQRTVVVSTLYRTALGPASRAASTQQGPSAAVASPPPRLSPLAPTGPGAAGEGDSVLRALRGHLGQLRQSGDQLYLFDFEPPTEFLDDELYMYEGSRTEPPCEETVTWLVSGTVREAPPADVAALRGAIVDPRIAPNGNARPVQPLAGRRVRALRPFAARSTTLFGELERAERRREAARLAQAVRSDGQTDDGAGFNGTVISEQRADTHSTQETQRILREVLVALCITLVLLLCGLCLLLLVRQGVVAPYMLPPWLGGTDQPARERWGNAVTKQDTFGGEAGVPAGEEDLDDEEMEEVEGDGDDEEDSSDG